MPLYYVGEGGKEEEISGLIEIAKGAYSLLTDPEMREFFLDTKSNFFVPFSRVYYYALVTMPK